MSAAVASPLPTLRHPVKWLKTKTITLIDLAIFIHIGTLIVVGLYYVVFELWAPITEAWHNVGPDVFGATAKSWSYTRHMLRDVGEGLLGGYLGQYIVWNHFKPKLVKLRAKGAKLNPLDKFEIALHVPNIKNQARLTGKQFAAAPLLGIVYAVPGFVLAILLVKWFHVHAPAEAATATYGQKVEAIFTGNYDKKVVGLAASIFLGRRPMKKVYDDAQLFFAERRVLLHKPLRFYHPPTFKARVQDLEQHGVSGTATHDTTLAAVMSIAVFGGVALAGLGYYVLTVIA